MRQYSTNAIYEHLKVQTNLLNKYLYIQEGNWILIYGNENTQPKLFLVVTRIKGTLDQPLTEFESIALQLLSGQPTPVRLLRFNEANFSDQVAISLNEENNSAVIIKTRNLYSQLFQPFDISADAGIATKAVNDATSSTFHDWQRSFLSGRITVSDVDLIQYNNEYKIEKIFELKRSYLSLATWRPYPADYSNFILLRRAFAPQISIIILYNYYSRNLPRIEDISVVRAYLVENDRPQFLPLKTAIKETDVYDIPLALIIF